MYKILMTRVVIGLYIILAGLKCFAENLDILPIINSEPLGIKGWTTSLSYENAFCRSSPNLTHHYTYFNMQYGLFSNFDLGINSSYVYKNFSKEKIYGFGDIFIFGKYCFQKNIISSSVALQLSVPTGYDQFISGYNQTISLQKKSYDLSLLNKFSHESISLYGNFGIFTLDDFQNHSQISPYLYYKLGISYIVKKFKNYNLEAVWNVSTRHHFHNNFDYTSGKNYLGICLKPQRQGLNLEAGFINHLYENNRLGFKLSLGYYCKGKQPTSHKKILDKYPRPLHLNIIEFYNPSQKIDTIWTKKTISKSLQKLLTTKDSITVSETALDSYLTLKISGAIEKLQFVRSNLINIPYLISIPTAKFVINFQVTISKKSHIIYKKRFSSYESKILDIAFFESGDYHKKHFISSKTKEELANICIEKASQDIIEDISDFKME